MILSVMLWNLRVIKKAFLLEDAPLLQFSQLQAETISWTDSKIFDNYKPFTNSNIKTYSPGLTLPAIPCQKLQHLLTCWHTASSWLQASFMPDPQHKTANVFLCCIHIHGHFSLQQTYCVHVSSWCFFLCVWLFMITMRLGLFELGNTTCKHRLWLILMTN